MKDGSVYPAGWRRVELLVSPDGREAHAIGGDRTAANPEVPEEYYPAFAQVQKWIKAYRNGLDISNDGGCCTATQKIQQSEGPGRPSVRALATMLDTLPSHLEVRAISVNGQTAVVIVETYYEGLEQSHEFHVG